MCTYMCATSGIAQPTITKPTVRDTVSTLMMIMDTTHVTTMGTLCVLRDGRALLLTARLVRELTRIANTICMSS